MKFRVDSFDIADSTGELVDSALTIVLQVAGEKIRGDHRVGVNAYPSKQPLELEIEDLWFGTHPVTTDTVKKAVLEHCGVKINFTTDNYGLLHMHYKGISDHNKFEQVVAEQKKMLSKYKK